VLFLVHIHGGAAICVGFYIHEEIAGVFSLRNFLDLVTVTLSFLFDN